jgi:MFS family permease
VAPAVRRLEASLIANLGPTLQDPRTLGLTAAQVGLANTTYLVGQVAGALGFGFLTDRYGRKRLFLVTLGLYLAATALSGLAPTLPVFLLFRGLAGAGIGGEYSAVNSAIDELVPARVRGQVDLAINGTYWATPPRGRGRAAGSVVGRGGTAEPAARGPRGGGRAGGGGGAGRARDPWAGPGPAAAPAGSRTSTTETSRCTTRAARRC